MEYYGRKSSQYGQAYRSESIDRKRPYYEALVRAGRKRARQEGKKQARDTEEGL